MITKLKVSNFALIEDVELSFNKGLTVLTGETGTGKSIILEALHLIFAKRSDQEMIRHGSNKAIVTANFSLDEEKKKLLDINDDLEITREIDSNGRHKITLNGKTITLSYLKEITNKLGLIHSQEDTLMLLDQNEYLNILDLLDQNKTNNLLNNYLLKRSSYLDAKKHLTNLLNKKEDEVLEKDFLEYQLNEIKSLNLEKDEKILLEDKVNKLKNFDKIYSNLKEANYNLSNTVNFESLYDTSKLIENIKDFDESYKDISERLINIYYELEDVKSNLNNSSLELDFDEREFNLYQERIYEIQKLEDKYKMDANKLIDFQEEIYEKLSLIENYDEYIKEYQQKVDKLFNEAYEEALKLSEYRKKLANKFTSLIINELKDLDLENTKFEVSFNTYSKENKTLLETGIDEIDFLISLNEGEPIRSLNKVASGGERARFLFAIKSIYANLNNLDILILDEIDIGISGKTAAKVASKMTELSKKMQLIVISHLPQVAARANNHFGINKTLINNRMVTQVKLLNDTERVKMIALMLSDEQLTEFAINQAKMLLKK